jgi:NAD(P)-dependent dehydrogenase (short-subunit alcohol dehydrogenase family)
VARTLEKAECAKASVLLTQQKSEDDSIITMECENTSFKSIRYFCQELRRLLDDDESGGIDVMCLNAAVLLGDDKGPQFTEDGLEVTFQTNHLAAFLIANLTYDLMNPGGRVVVTTSGLHSYASFKNFDGVFDRESGEIKRSFQMIDGSEWDHKQSYSASKLSNATFCLELNRRLQQRNVIAVCFTPGLIPDSGLFRHQKQWRETLLKKEVMGMIESEEWGGMVLAWMALSDKAGQKGGEYWRAPYGISHRGGNVNRDMYTTALSEEATDPQNQKKLWQLSADLAGIHCHSFDEKPTQ